MAGSIGGLAGTTGHFLRGGIHFSHRRDHLLGLLMVTLHLPFIITGTTTDLLYSARQTFGNPRQLSHRLLNFLHEAVKGFCQAPQFIVAVNRQASA